MAQQQDAGQRDLYGPPVEGTQGVDVGQPARLLPIQPLKGPAIAAAGAAALVTVAELVEVGTAAAAGDTLRRAAAQGVAPADVLTVQDVAVLPTLLLLLAGWIAASVWLWRARGNAEVLSPGAHHARGRAWAIWGWITPVVALWFPLQVVRDVYRASAPHARSAALVGSWWALFIAYSLSGQVGQWILGGTEPNSGAASTLLVAEGVNAAFALAAAVLWVSLVHLVTRGQEQRGRHVLTGTAPPAPERATLVEGTNRHPVAKVFGWCCLTAVVAQVAFHLVVGWPESAYQAGRVGGFGFIPFLITWGTVAEAAKSSKTVWTPWNYLVRVVPVFLLLTALVGMLQAAARG